MQLDQIDIGRVNRYLKATGLGTVGSADERVKRLSKYYITKYHAKEISLVRCDSCDGYSDEALSECPYCGETGQVEPEAAVEAAIPNEGDDVHAQAPGESKLVQGAAPAGKPASGQSSAPVDAKSPEQIEVEDEGEPTLDQVVGRIRQAGRVAAGQIHQIGQGLKTIRDKKLWRQRLTDEGTQAYAGFYAFVEAEVGFRHAYASRMIGVAEAFTTEQIQEYGITRLSVALRVPGEKRREYLSKAKSTAARGPSLAKLADQVNSGQADTLHQVTIPLGAQVVPMYRRPKEDEDMHEPTTPAKSLRDKPWLRLDLPGDLVLFVRLTRNTSGELEAVVEHRIGSKVEPAS